MKSLSCHPAVTKGQVRSSFAAGVTGFILLAVCSLTVPAQAGHWRIATAGSIDSSSTGHEEWTESERFSDEGRIEMSAFSSEAISANFPSASSGSANYTATLIWIPDNDDLVGDPPPRYALLAAVRTSVVRFGAFSQPAQDYHGMTAGAVLDPDIGGETHFVDEGDYAIEDEDRRIQFFASTRGDGKLIYVNNSDGSSRVLIGAISVMAGTDIPAMPEMGDTLYAYANAECHATFCLVDVSIQAWRKFSDSSNIAAGGIDSFEHKADVKIEISPIHGLDVGELLGRIRVRKGKGVRKNARFVPTAPVEHGTGVIVGELISSDKAKESGQEVMVKLRLSGSPSDPAAVLHQHWDHGHQWNGGADGTGPVEQTFSYTVPAEGEEGGEGGSEGGNSLTFSPSFDGVPITGHTMKFLTEQAYVKVWDPGLGRYVTGVVSDGGAGGGEPEASSPTAGLAKYSPESVTGGSAYSTNMTVAYDARKLVIWVKPAAEDQDAYGGPGSQQ